MLRSAGTVHASAQPTPADGAKVGEGALNMCFPHFSCGGLNRNGHQTHVFECLACRECVPVGAAFEVSYAKLYPVVAGSLLLPKAQDVEL